MDFLFWLPADLGLPAALLILAASFFSSALTAAFGLGGGITMLAVLALVLPVAAVIPIHGVVQLGSCLSRTFVQRRMVRWQMVWPFLLGALVGALVGARFVVALPEAFLKSVLGVFILAMLWGKIPVLKLRVQRLVFALIGVVTSFLTMFLGATGPFVAAFVAPALGDRREVIGTHAAMMTFQHLFKVIAFSALGFAFAAWVPLLAGLLAVGFLGTLAGSHGLSRMREADFRLAFRLLVSVLALDLIRRGLTPLFA